MTVTDGVVAAARIAVERAASLTASAQGRLLAGETLTKDDASPVTVADFAAQAVVCATLAARLGDVSVVGEEDASDLGGPSQSAMLEGVTRLAGAALGADPSTREVLDWIAVGGASADTDRYWTLDPIDGTKGFLRGDQYAIALALIEDGHVVLGVLGCPNLPNADGSTGSIFVAVDGSCDVYVGGSTRATPVRVDGVTAAAGARFCESVESGHSDQGQSAEIAALLGITADPFRIDSQCKYGAVARGDASIYLRLPTRADYQEKIWDHAAGKYVVECAGGRVTDVHGADLDFGRGAFLSANSGVIATSGAIHDDVVSAVRSVLG